MLRLQTPDGETKMLEPDSTWTLAELRQAAATACGLSVAQIELRAGFPPQPLSGEDSALVTSALGAGGARVIVRRAGVAPAQAHNPHGSGGRKKAQPQRLAEGAQPPRDLAPESSGGSAQKSDFAERMSEAKKRKREAQGGATAPRATGGSGRINPNADPLALTMAQARGSSGGGGSSGDIVGSLAADKVKVKARSAEQLASEIYSGSGGALQSAARGGGKTGDFLSEHAMIEHRTNALSKRVYETAVLAKPTPKACEQLSATFKGTRKQLCEIVQLLRREELKQVLKALSSKGSSSRGGAANHLLTPSALAARSPAVFWSLAHVFDGDIAAGVEELHAELLSEARDPI